MIRYFLPILLLLCTSCIQLGSESDMTRYYLLEPVAETHAIENNQQFNITIGSIEFPSYLDRPQIVSHSVNNAIVVAIHDRWAEPFPENFSRVLQENLYRQRGNSSSMGPGFKENAYEVKIIINHFDGIVGQSILVDIRWELQDSANKQVLIRKHFISQLPIADNYQALANGLSISLANFSQEIAQELAEELELK